jgi:hypothetical protein
LGFASSRLLLALHVRELRPPSSRFPHQLKDPRTAVGLRWRRLAADLEHNREVKTWATTSDAVVLGPKFTRHDMERMEREYAKTRRRFDRHFDTARLGAALRAYCAACDSSDYDTILQRLWTTLEILTNASEGESAIKRTASMYRERSFVEEFVTYFANCRHGLTHAARPTGTDRVILDKLREHVHRVLQENLLNEHGATSFDELFEPAHYADDVTFGALERKYKRAVLERKRRRAAS